MSQRFALLLVLPLVAGCAAGPGAWVGRWEGRRAIPVGPGQDPSVAYTLGQVELEIHEDGSFEMIEAGMPKTGRGRYSANRAELRIETLLGRPIDEVVIGDKKRTVTLERLRDGTVRFLGAEPINRTPLNLRKVQPHEAAGRTDKEL